MPFQLPFTPEQASSFAGEVDNLTVFLVAYSALFSALIAFLVIFLSFRYRRTHPNQVGSNFDNSTLLELTWTIIPLIIVIITFVWGAKVFFTLWRTPVGAVEYHVTGKQWMWKLQHPEGPREINELHVPVGQTTKLIMTSEDVIHSFYVPAFRVKADVIPGRYTSIWFKATKPGRYHLFCTEYCGVEHSRMIGWVYVQQPEEHQEWLAAGPSVLPAAAGEQLFAQYACGTCHKAERNERGPSLHGLYGSEVRLADGRRVRADENYLRESILNPTAKAVDGYPAIMPMFQGQINEEGVLQLISYIKSLPPAEQVAPAAQAASEAGGATR